MTDEICAAPGCGKPSAKATQGTQRSINGEQLCRGCYQRIWELARNSGKTLAEVFQADLAPPRRALPRIATTCAAPGCSTFLEANASDNVRRTIGTHHVCRNCYMRAWQLAQDRGGGVTIEEAFSELPPRRSPRG